MIKNENQQSIKLSETIMLISENVFLTMKFVNARFRSRMVFCFIKEAKSQMKTIRLYGCMIVCIIDIRE